MIDARWAILGGFVCSIAFGANLITALTARDDTTFVTALIIMVICGIIALIDFIYLWTNV